MKIGKRSIEPRWVKEEIRKEICLTVVVKDFNPSTPEAKAGRPL